MNQRKLIGIFAVMALMTCGGLWSATSCDPSPDSLAAAPQRIIKADNSRDVDAALAGYTADVTWLPPNGEAVHGKSAIRARYEQLFAANMIELRSAVLDAHAADGLAVVVGTTSGTITPLQGGPKLEVNDKFIAVLRCENGEWLVSHLAWSPRARGNP